jgi:hypothetical protein
LVRSRNLLPTYMLQTNRHQQYLYPDNMETITDSPGARRGSPEHDPAESLACSGLRAQLRLEQRLLRSKDENGLWWGHLSSETIVA